MMFCIITSIIQPLSHELTLRFDTGFGHLLRHKTHARVESTVQSSAEAFLNMASIEKAPCNATVEFKCHECMFGKPSLATTLITSMF